jgi:hypothetical protein
VFQFFATLVLLVAAVVIQKQMRFINYSPALLGNIG